MTERDSVQPWMKKAAKEITEVVYVKGFVGPAYSIIEQIIAEHAKEQSAPTEKK
jgi:hypothetical protein